MAIVLIPCLNIIQHPWSLSTLPIPASFLLRNNSELTLLSCTGNFHLNAELQLLGKRKDYSTPTNKCSPHALAPMQTNSRHWPQALQQNPGIPLQLRLEPARSDKLLLHNSTACTALIACYNCCSKENHDTSFRQKVCWTYRVSMRFLLSISTTMQIGSTKIHSLFCKWGLNQKQ